MKIGYTVWTWLVNAMSDWETYGPYAKRDFEQSLREVSHLGYPFVENFNILVKMYEDCAEEFDALLDKYNLKFVNIYHFLSDDFDADMKLAERCCNFVLAHDAAFMNIQAPWIPKGGYSRDLVDVTVKLTEMGRLCRDKGVTMCLHPHYGTTVFQGHEIDYVVNHTDPEYLSLCMDTAHTTLAGLDPAVAFSKYFDRIRYIHLKDVDPEVSHEQPMRGFTALGQGVINFRAIFNTLKMLGYDGVLMVESDNRWVCNYETAMVSRNYLHRVLGQ